MELSSAFIANFAEIRGGVGNFLGAYAEWWEVQSLPSTALMHLVAIAELAEDELGTEFPIVVQLHRPGGKVEQLATGTAQRDKGDSFIPGAPVHHIIIMPTPLILADPELHVFTISIGDKTKDVPLWVRVPPPATPTVKASVATPRT